MGLAIDGNVVNGIARGGQAFVPVEQLPQISSDGSITYNGKQYDTKLKVTDYFYRDLGSLSFDNNEGDERYALSAGGLDCTKYIGKKAILFYDFKYGSAKDSSGNPEVATATNIFELQKVLGVASGTGDGQVDIAVNSSENNGFVINCESQNGQEKSDAEMLLLIFN